MTAKMKGMDLVENIVQCGMLKMRKDVWAPRDKFSSHVSRMENYKRGPAQYTYSSSTCFARFRTPFTEIVLQLINPIFIWALCSQEAQPDKARS